MRPAPACTTCRTRRRKCVIPISGSACTYCSERGIRCTVSASNQQSPVDSFEPIAPIPSPENAYEQDQVTTGLPSLHLCVELVELYFDFIHDKFHSLFHRSSLVEEVWQRRAPPIILYGMLALSARFSTNQAFASIDPRVRAEKYAEKCERLLDLRNVSLMTVQACVLLGTISVTEGAGAPESVYYAVACRVAQLLDLPNRPTPDKVEKEVNLRVWWTLTMIDVWSSSGVRLPRLLRHQDDIPLPMEEIAFLHLRRDDVDTDIDIAPGRDSSLLTQMIKLNRILVEVNDVNSLAVAGRLSGAALEQVVNQVSQKLDNWRASLPEYMHDTPANLARYASLGLGRVFVTVYLGYYNYGQLLYYQFLHEDCHSTMSSANLFANKCKFHAARLCEIIYNAISIPGCEVWYTMVGHILVISSTVQIHILLFGDDPEQIRSARSRLEKNFEILMKLRSYWPILDVSMTRLRAFHKSCQNYMDTAFMMDRWMLQFLFEFATPVHDKYADEEVDLGVWSVDDVVFM